MNSNSEAFEHWIRTAFVEMNTELEELYFKQPHREQVEGVGDAIKAQIRDEGHEFVVRLLAEGNTDEGFDNAFDLLGDLGLYLGALRRHELTNPAREEKSPFPEASALGLHIAASVGMAPRFATAHLATRNAAVNGRQKSFTTLKDEFLLLNDAANALRDVIKYNDALFRELDTDRFFYSVRPYYKPYRVGRHEYRGANAGDFSGINEIDMLLGLCQANDPYYAQLLVDKMLFMTPEDQASLRDCMRRRSLLAQFLDVAPTASKEPWFKRNAAAFLEVCELHGKTAAQHHNQLVKSFIEKPSSALEADKLAQVTASGPPLQVLMRALEILRDMRLAADRDDIRTSYKDIEALKGYVAA